MTWYIIHSGWEKTSFAQSKNFLFYHQAKLAGSEVYRVFFHIFSYKLYISLNYIVAYSFFQSVYGLYIYVWIFKREWVESRIVCIHIQTLVVRSEKL